MKHSCRALLLAAAALASLPHGAAAQTYRIDPDHTFPSFEVPHLRISLFRGQFTRTQGTIVLDRAVGTGMVDIVIDAASIRFGHPVMDKKMQEPDYFDVQKHPQITYRGRTMRFENGKPVEIQGELTLLGNTRPLALKVLSFNCVEHPLLKKEVCGADATGSFDRTDFGLATGAQRHGSSVTLRIQVEGVRAD